LTKKYDTLKKKFDSQAVETTSLQAQIAQLTTSLSEARSENKTLSAKLAATRVAAASVESAHSRTPGSALKANGGIRLMGTAEAAQVAQAAQLKEDLYRDLTGLIIRGVKRETEEDIFDCLQTGGRNGSKYNTREAFVISLIVIQHSISSLPRRMRNLPRVMTMLSATIFPSLTPAETRI
jgi:hypothetical protein